ncbi:MAG: DUF1826 domain-containing protein [Pseudomonadota bacterium]
MNVLQPVSCDTAPGVGIVSDCAALDVFCTPGCAAAIWRRQIPPAVSDWLNRLPDQTLPQGRVIIPVGAISKSVDQLCDSADTPHGPERVWLQQDIVDLAQVFTDLMNTRYLRLRLDVIRTNACRKFHVDAIKGRLVCTYRGTGTQFGTSENDCDPERVFTVETGAPILLRGTLWPETPRAGLRHRSPPIEGTGETRLVLVVDPVADPEAGI